MNNTAAPRHLKDDVMFSESRPQKLANAYAQEVLNHAGNLPLDIARSLLESYTNTASNNLNSGKETLEGEETSQCPKCSTPWIAGFCQSRIMSCPRTARSMRSLFKKERRNVKKLSKREKLLLELHRRKKNVLEVMCLICKHKKTQLCPLPKKLVKRADVQEPEPTLLNKKKKKKKKKSKDLYAGLILSSSTAKTNDPCLKGLSTSLENKVDCNNSQLTTNSIDLGGKNDKSWTKKDDANACLDSKCQKKENLSCTEIIRTSGESKSDSGDGKLSNQHSSNSVVPSTPTVDSKERFKANSSRNSKFKPLEIYPSNSLKEQNLLSKPVDLVSKKKKKEQLQGLKNAAIRNLTNPNNQEKCNTLSDFLATLI